VLGSGYGFAFSQFDSDVTRDESGNVVPRDILAFWSVFSFASGGVLSLISQAWLPICFWVGFILFCLGSSTRGGVLGLRVSHRVRRR